MNRQSSLLLVAAIAACALAIVLRQLLFPKADWWNLVIVGLLLAALVAHIWRNRFR
jgi:presenilin-like A22 family membrane protease